MWQGCVRLFLYIIFCSHIEGYGRQDSARPCFTACFTLIGNFFPSDLLPQTINFLELLTHWKNMVREGGWMMLALVKIIQEAELCNYSNT